MPRRKEQFEVGDIGHAILRAIDDNLLFKNTNDYYRGVFSIYEFNNAKPVTIQRRREVRNSFKELLKLRGAPSSTDSGLGEEDERDKIVEVLAFCFMPNHIHLLLKF